MNKKSAFGGGDGITVPGTIHYRGKVRDVYTTKDKKYLASVASDRVSCFDVILPKPIPEKGIILNLMAKEAFEALGDKVPHWYLASPHIRVHAGYACTAIPVEVIVRGNLAGSIWKKYKKGQRVFWGHELPDGLKEYSKLPYPIITPTTKEKIRHDQDITTEMIIENGLCSKKNWERIEELAMIAFKIGTQYAAERGLIMLDTKYEFGLDTDGVVLLIDEVHTPDSSRFIYADGYEEKLENNQQQKELSKEFIRKWLEERGFEGKEGQVMPEITEDDIQDFRNIYLELLKVMTGKTLEESMVEDLWNDPGSISKRITHFIRNNRTPKVSIIMGSDSDLPVMEEAAFTLDELCVGYEATIVSAHRTPERMVNYAKKLTYRGIDVVIAGAGGAAHLPGMVAALAPGVPVVGVPIKSSNSIAGLDSLLSIVQMPGGVPVATVAINQAKNAAIIAAQTLAISDKSLFDRVVEYNKILKDKVLCSVEKISKDYIQPEI